MLLTNEQIIKLVSEIENISVIRETNLEEALLLYMELWDKLPKPKHKQPEQISNWIIDCIFKLYLQQGNYVEAKKWAIEGLKNDTAEYDSYEYIQIGRVSYELNEFDEALKYFDIAYQRGKKRAFQGFDKKYWEFYSKNKDKLKI